MVKRGPLSAGPLFHSHATFLGSGERLSTEELTASSVQRLYPTFQRLGTAVKGPHQ